MTSSRDKDPTRSKAARKAARTRARNRRLAAEADRWARKRTREMEKAKLEAEWEAPVHRKLLVDGVALVNLRLVISRKAAAALRERGGSPYLLLEQARNLLAAEITLLTLALPDAAAAAVTTNPSKR